MKRNNVKAGGTYSHPQYEDLAGLTTFFEVTMKQHSCLNPPHVMVVRFHFFPGHSILTRGSNATGTEGSRSLLTTQISCRRPSCTVVVHTCLSNVFLMTHSRHKTDITHSFAVTHLPLHYCC
jgi:hypothetical protein